MKTSDLRERSTEDLNELLASLRKEGFETRFKNHTNRLDDTSSISKSRRDVARVLTVLSERKAAAAGEQKAGAQ